MESNHDQDTVCSWIFCASHAGIRGLSDSVGNSSEATSLIEMGAGRKAGEDVQSNGQVYIDRRRSKDEVDKAIPLTDYFLKMSNDFSHITSNVSLCRTFRCSVEISHPTLRDFCR
jgi:hypothetical protein